MVYRGLMAGVALLALAGCGGGAGRGGVFAAHRGGTPDEFAVGRAQPLTVPPDFALVPPRPGQPRPQEADSSQQALNALFGGQQRASAGETALTAAAGAAPTPGVRSEVGTGTTVVVNKGSATRDILNAAPVSNAQADATTTAATPSTDATTPNSATPDPTTAPPR